ncbi:phosphomannomutase/phosphoglucomutase [Patescibacteria group bacterium]|nr:phosphomannomutase/phosphoglucomutase [Patescibacteria group bacterium]
MKINPDIFKAYDIRGVYPDDLNEDVAYQIGRAFADFVESDKIIVGRDIRESGLKLHDALVRGITDQGADVSDIGLVGTDMFYFACGSMGLPGITVTASHNPREYNGFKMVKKMPDLVSGEKIRDVVLAGNFPEASKKGTVEDVDIKEGYREKILSLADTSKIPSSLKIAVDPANGMGGPAFDLIYKDLPVEIARMFFEPDGTFPNHGGDPLKEENRKDLEERVKSENADLGFAFDTDADRFFVVDSSGNYVPSDYLGALIARYLIEKNGKHAIVHDAIIGWAVRDLVKEAGGATVASPVGHVYIKAKMGETKAVFGIEKSGHYYLPDFYFAETAVGMSLVLLEMLGYYGKKLDELVAPLREKYYMIEQENYEVDDPDAVIARVKERYSSECEIDEMDGISVIADNWHANVRKSNTEPVVRLNVEALDDKKLMEEKRDEFLELIQK